MGKNHNYLYQNYTEVKEVNPQKVFNYVGVFLFAGFALNVFTDSVYSLGEIKDFSMFLGITAFLYFLILNLYFFNEITIKISLIIMSLLSISTVFMMIYLYLNLYVH